GTLIPANGYLLLNEQSSYGQAAGSPGVLSSFSFDGDGNNSIVLSQADAAGNLMGYRQLQDYGATDVGQTVGRYVKSTLDTDFTIQKSATPAAARSLYASTPAAVTVLGPVSGFLNNGGEKIPLQRPGMPETTPTGTVVPYITVDKLNYDSKAPWPTTPNELGRSLIRINPL